MHSIETRCYSSGKYTVCKLVRASFIPEMLQVGAMKGWMTITITLSVVALSSYTALATWVEVKSLKEKEEEITRRCLHVAWVFTFQDICHSCLALSTSCYVSHALKQNNGWFSMHCQNFLQACACFACASCWFALCCALLRKVMEICSLKFAALWMVLLLPRIFLGWKIWRKTRRNSSPVSRSGTNESRGRH